jgi:hypothetical protein
MKGISMLVSSWNQLDTSIFMYKCLIDSFNNLEEKRKRRKIEQEQKTYQYSYDDKSQPNIGNNVEEKILEPEEIIEDLRCNFQIPSDLEKVTWIRYGGHG